MASVFAFELEIETSEIKLLEQLEIEASNIGLLELLEQLEIEASNMRVEILELLGFRPAAGGTGKRAMSAMSIIMDAPYRAQTHTHTATFKYQGAIRR